MTIADQLASIASTKALIKTSIENKGATVGSIPFASYPAKIDSISTVASDWTRPSDWLALPTLTETDNKIVALYAVFPHDSNFLTVRCYGAYTINWGDGTSENFASGVIAYHNFTYANISASTLCSRGYRQCIITITPQSGQNLTSASFTIKHTQTDLQYYYSNNFLDMSIASANLTALALGVASTGVSNRMLEQVTVIKASLTTVVSMFTNCSALQSIPVLNIGNNFTSCSGMFYGCTSLKSIALFDTSKVTVFTNMFYGCNSLKTVPLFNTSLGTTFTGMFNSCSSLCVVPPFDTSKGSTFISMFAYCTNLQYIPSINTSLGISVSSMFNTCSTLQYITNLDLSADTATATSSIFLSCTSLSSVIISNIQLSISFTGCRLSESALVAIFNGLATTTGQTITITGNWGASLLTTAERAIATGKGWTLVG